jgi:hypothetical protein
MSIPFFFRPIQFIGRRLYDGGMTKNFPIHAALDRVGGNVDFIALYLGSGQPSRKYRRWMPLELLDVWLNQDEYTVLQKYPDKIVVIDTHPISTTDFDISSDEKTFLVQKGRAAAIRHLFRLKARHGKQATDFPSEADVLRAEAAANDAYHKARRRRVRRRLVAALKLLAIAAVTISLFAWRRFSGSAPPSPTTTVTTAFTSYRSPVKYHVSLHDAPSQNTHFIIAASQSKYLFYEAEVDYVRYPAWPGEYLLVAAITDPSSYAGWVRAKDVVYREIIGLDPSDVESLRSFEAAIKAATSTTDRYLLLQGLMRITVAVNGKELPLNAFSREPFGFVLQFANPSYGVDTPSARYSFRAETFQPKTLNLFPFIASELFQSLDYRLDYSDTTITGAELFSAFLFDPANEVVVSHDAQNRILTASSQPPKWVYPGGGIALTWESRQ